MKNTILALSLLILTTTSMAQTITFTTQSKVDSFVAVMDTSINYYLKFEYDPLVNKQDTISDLSGFNTIRIVRIEVNGFKWVDLPWFNNIFVGRLNIIDMPHLKTISAVKNYEGRLIIDNCPSLNSYPPKGVLKYCNSLYITNITRPVLVVDLSEIPYNPRGANWANKVDIIDNDIQRLIINDPNNVAVKLIVSEDSAMEYFEFNGGVNYALGIKDNPKLNTVRGFKNTVRIATSSGIMNNPQLTDICVMKNGLDSFYRSLSSSNKHSFMLSNNGPGASSYIQMMNADCSYLDTLYNSNETVLNNQIQEWVIYPNPCSGYFYVSNGSSETVEQNWVLINGLGKTEREWHNQRAESLFDVSGLSPGIYFLQGKGQVKKVIVK